MKVSFELLPFLALSVIGFFCCICVRRLRKYALRVLVGPTAFGLCSLLGLWIGALVWSRALPLLGSRVPGNSIDQAFFTLLGGGFLLLGVGGTWLAVGVARQPWNTRIVALVFSLVLLVLIIASTSVLTCTRRGYALQRRQDALQREAGSQLRIGTGKEQVTRFFDEHGMKASFAYGEASGTLFTSGCAPFVGCGDDSAIIGLRVEVDSAGNVIAQPTVVSMYTNCL